MDRWRKLERGKRCCGCHSSLGAQVSSGVDSEVLSLFQSHMRGRERSGTATWVKDNLGGRVTRKESAI